MYLLITIVLYLNTGTKETLFTEYKSKAACLKAKKEDLKWQNENNKTQAYCIKSF